MSESKSAPGEARTPNPWFRRPMLYPIELRAHHLVDGAQETIGIVQAVSNCASRQKAAIALAWLNGRYNSLKSRTLRSKIPWNEATSSGCTVRFTPFAKAR